jgi:two-component system OmpR family response regulator
MAPPPNATVVVLEDHPDTCELFAQQLAAAGFDVLAPRENEDVIALVQALTSPVAVIVDIGLSGAGYALAARLVTLKPPPRLIAVTGRPPEDVPNAKLFDAYLLKPCDPEDLVAAVSRALSGSPSPRAADTVS